MHHLAFTGAIPPKMPGIKELETFIFAEEDMVSSFEFQGKMKEIDDEEVNMGEEEIKALPGKEAQLEKTECPESRKKISKRISTVAEMYLELPF